MVLQWFCLQVQHTTSPHFLCASSNSLRKSLSCSRASTYRKIHKLASVKALLRPYLGDDWGTIKASVFQLLAELFELQPSHTCFSLSLSPSLSLSRICEHNRIKSQCEQCGGSSICEHNRQRSQCKQCGGASICEHNRRRSECKQCGGSIICEHSRQRSGCKPCGGASICERTTAEEADASNAAGRASASTTA